MADYWAGKRKIQGESGISCSTRKQENRKRMRACQPERSPISQGWNNVGKKIKLNKNKINNHIGL